MNARSPDAADSVNSLLVDHNRAVETLRASFARGHGAGVRLAKPTTNVFRFRTTGSRSLDVTGLRRVLRVDPAERIAEVQGMTTYEDLVDATLPYGLMPRVVPQLKTITLGGAVAGLGIESTSFRNGLPHESVREIEILTGAGEVVVARPDNQHRDLFDGFPNSYGTLGYALRLIIDLEPVKPYVALRHIPFEDADECAAAITDICAQREFEGQPVDFIDGTVFDRHQHYLTLGRFTDRGAPVSDYTGKDVYYRSIPRRRTDHLRVHDYLWRWDTDWFWCSRAFGVQHPVIRRLWPRRYRRSDVYRKIVGFDQRYELSRRCNELLRRPARENVIQDVEVPVDRLTEFLDFFHRDIGMRPVWLCPLRLQRTQPWPLYPLDPDTLYVNVGFWGTVPLAPGEADRGDRNRRIEAAVAELGGHKSLYSTVHYDPDEFWRLYNGEGYRKLKSIYDPRGRLLDLYDKCVRES